MYVEWPLWLHLGVLGDYVAYFWDLVEPRGKKTAYCVLSKSYRTGRVFCGVGFRGSGFRGLGV